MDERARLGKKLEARDVTDWNRQMYVVRIFDQSDVLYDLPARRP